MNWYKRYIGDYQRDTGHLSMVEHGAYTLMLDTQYATAKPLPENQGVLFRLLRAITEAEQAAVQVVLKQFWRLTEDGWINARATIEIDKYMLQAATNLRIAVQRTVNEPYNEPYNEQATNRTTNRTTNRPPNQKPDTRARKQNQKPKPEPEKEVPAPKTKSLARTASHPTWDAYSQAYTHRYGVEPTRNRKVNSQLKQFTERVPIEEAPAIVAFYLSHNNAYYLRTSHSTDALLKDAEKLRTEWQTGRKVTGRKALQDEQTATNFDNANRAIAILERRDRERTSK